VNLKLVAAGSAAALALGGAGAAAAGSSPGPAQHTTQALDVTAGVAVFDAALAYLQIDKQVLVQDLRSGQSLAQIAIAQGKTADGLVNAAVAAAQTQLDNAVDAGSLGKAREQVLLTKLRTSLNALVKKGLAGAKQAGTQRPQPVTMLLQPLTAYLKLHIRTVPDNKLKTNISLGTHA
jgi:hypothetical protein